MDENFDIFTEEDKTSTAYAMCVAGTTIVGGAVGAATRSPIAIVVLAAAGLGYGLMACPRLAPAIKKKLLSSNAVLSDSELSQALRVVRDETGVRTKSDALAVLAQARQQLAAGGMDNGQAPQSMRIAAIQILNHSA